MTLEEFENSDDGWVEWPSFDDQEPEQEKFDWSLSMAEMEKKYNLARTKPVRRVYHYTKRVRPKPKPNPKTIATRRNETVKNSGTLNYKGADCVWVGFIDRNIGHGISQYQNAYYHPGEEKYVFASEAGVVAYHKQTLEKYIKPFFPGAEDLKLSVNTNTARVPKKETLDQVVNRLLSQPQQNFHYQ